MNEPLDRIPRPPAPEQLDPIVALVRDYMDRRSLAMRCYLEEMREVHSHYLARLAEASEWLDGRLKKIEAEGETSS